MKRHFILSSVPYLLVIFSVVLSISAAIFFHDQTTGAPPYGEPESSVPQDIKSYLDLQNWKRPNVPVKVGVQVGHWQNENAPEEQVNLRKNHGASAAGVNEVDINLSIATLIKQNLESAGIQVDLLPTNIPPNYWADVFISIHSDGSDDATKSGYKFAGPWRDFTGKSQSLIDIIEPKYYIATKFTKDTNITRNMRGYYAFAWWRYEHSIHPMTTAIIAETGFVTNSSNRQLLVDSPQIPAQAISDGIIKHLKQQQLL